MDIIPQLHRWYKCSAFRTALVLPWAFLVAQTVKNLLAMWETRIQPLGRKTPWRRNWQPTVAFLPGELHGEGPDGLEAMGSQRVTTEWLTLLLSHSHTPGGAFQVITLLKLSLVVSHEICSIRPHPVSCTFPPPAVCESLEWAVEFGWGQAGEGGQVVRPYLGGQALPWLC